MRESSNLRDGCGFCGVSSVASTFSAEVSLTALAAGSVDSVGSGRLLSCAQPAADSSIAAANSTAQRFFMVGSPAFRLRVQ